MNYRLMPNYLLITLFLFSVVQNVNSVVTELNNYLAKIAVSRTNGKWIPIQILVKEFKSLFSLEKLIRTFIFSWLLIIII